MDLRAERLIEVLASLQGQRTPRGAREKRGEPRVGLRYQVKIRLLSLNPPTGAALTGAAPTKAWLRDLSGQGVGIMCAFPISKGEAFAIQLARADGSVMEVRCEATNCTAVSAGIYQIGAKLTDMPRQLTPKRRESRAEHVTR